LKKGFCSWSGGKDSCLAYYLAKQEGITFSCLFNVLDEDGETSCTHGLPASLMRLQAKLAGVPLVQVRTNGIRYEEDLRKQLHEFREQGIDFGVYGNGDISPIWIGGVSKEEGLTPLFPLKDINKTVVLQQLIALEFETIVVTARADLLGPQWLGKKVDEQFIGEWEELKKRHNITPEQEAGLYHTLVLAGPIFKGKLEIQESEKVLRNGYWFLDVRKIIAVQ
jgi:diphthine-ammonia ligase